VTDGADKKPRPTDLRRWKKEVVDGLASLPREHASALLCVERDARACHRSLIAERLAEEHGARVVDLVA